MKKSSTAKRKPTLFFIAFLAIALVFLALGMGTLGSLDSVGEDFELRAPTQSADGTEQTSTVIFALSRVYETYPDENGEEQTHEISVEVSDVYLFVDAIYSEAGTPVTVSLRRSSSSNNYFSSQVTASLENLYTDPPAEGEEAPAVQQDALYRWVHPFTFTSKSSASTYAYWELTVTGANVRIAEVLFVGTPTSIETDNTQDRYIIPASISSATPDTDETMEQAREKAGALLDGDLNVQANADKSKRCLSEDMIPSEPVSSYDTFTKEEIYSLLTVTEMRVGRYYTTDVNGNVTNVYHAESVYNVLGMDLVALGTLMFGVTPFGLRFMPMLFSFGILVLGFFFTKRLFKSDRAGFLFAALYALCDFSFSLGHVGTPLTAGIFFLLLAAYCVDSFYRRGIKKVGFMGLAPLLFGGLSAAAAICVNGAMLIPVLGVCALYVAAMIRQQKANRSYLERAMEEYEAQAVEGEDERGKKKVAAVVAQNRYKNLAAGFLFPVALILGTVLFSLLFILPVYPTLLKVYDGNIVSPTMNVFSLGWKAFLGGFVGENVIGGMPSAWGALINRYVLFRGAGEAYAITAAIMNPVALVCGLIGIVYAVYKIIRIAKNFSEEGKELRRILPLLAGVVLSLVTAAFGGGALGFIFLAFLFSFMLAAYAAEDCLNLEGAAGKAAKGVTITALVLLLVGFALFAIFTFSVPLPASFMDKFFQHTIL